MTKEEIESLRPGDKLKWTSSQEPNNWMILQYVVTDNLSGKWWANVIKHSPELKSEYGIDYGKAFPIGFREWWGWSKQYFDSQIQLYKEEDILIERKSRLDLIDD